MTAVFPLAFPVYALAARDAVLTRASITNSENTLRYIVDIANDKCRSIARAGTIPSPEPLAYVSNPLDEFPLLLSVPPQYHRLKLQIKFKGNEKNINSSLIILKSFGDDVADDLLKEFLQRDDYLSRIRDVSEIAYDKFLPEDHTLDDYEVIVNDTFNSAKFTDSRLNVSVWEHTAHSAAYNHLFSFQFWVQPSTQPATLSLDSDVNAPLPPVPAISPGVLGQKLRSVGDRSISGAQPPSTAPAFISTPTASFNNHNTTLRKPSTPSDENARSQTAFLVSDFRKAFRLSITDGPEFRSTLARYERDVLKLKKTIHALHDDVAFMELTFRRVVNTKNAVLDTLDILVDSQFNPLLRRFELCKNFRKNFLVYFDSIEKKTVFLIKEVLDSNLLSKMSSYLSAVTPQEGSDSSVAKKTFEKNSKEYYDWLQKYLSNEKDRPELKLLAKRKNFELSKFDYLNSLNLASNNQYFNQFLENIFKFSSPDFRFSKVDPKLFRANSPWLLSSDATLYLNSLSRFNSEKLQLRQMIEASASNEELSEVLKLNSLAAAKDHDKAEDDLRRRMSSTKLDLVFTTLNQAIPGPQSAHKPLPSLGAAMNSGEEHSGEIAGILYALGGKGKPGWHKEWVSLKEGQLMEYSDWRKGKQLINKPIDIALASVKPINYDKRHFCFEVMTSSGTKHVFQAINDDDREQWIKALYSAGQVTQRLYGEKKKTTPRHQNGLKLHLEQPRPPPAFNADEGLTSPVSVMSSSVAPPPSEEKDVNLLKTVYAVENSDNHVCADCGSRELVEWVSMTFLVAICVQCSSCHRNMGTHVSKVRSLRLDNFENETRVLLGYVNNRNVDSYLEYDSRQKISPDCDNDVRLAYVKQKYMTKAFVKRIPDCNNALVQAVREINIPEVIKALNCGADAGLTLQMGSGSEDTPRINVSLFEYSLRKLLHIEEPDGLREYFVISELLLFNGCKVDTFLHVELHHTEEAHAYWREKLMRLG